ncbi:hypothetical protein KI387_004667, partial [Taxus chinensis]
SVLENAHRTATHAQGGGYRTAALFRAVTDRRPFVTEDQKGQEKREKRGKTKDTGAKWGMRDVNAYPKSSFWIPNTLRGDLYHHWGIYYTVP